MMRVDAFRNGPLRVFRFSHFFGCSAKPSANAQRKEEAVTHAEAPHPIVNPLPGMPPAIDPADIHSEDHAGKMNPVAAKRTRLGSEPGPVGTP
jgi:hypothetical protein